MDAYSFGQYLRAAREDRGVELGEAVATLRIRQPILEAFEAGEFEIANLSDIQARGMLRNYARFLQLDDEDVLRLYREARFGKEGRSRWRWRREARLSSRDRGANRGDAAAPMQEIDFEQVRAARWRRWISVTLLFLFSAVAVATIVFVTSELMELPEPEEGEDALLLADAVTEIFSTETRPPPPSFTPSAVAPALSNRAVYLGSGALASILTTQRAWIRVLSDGVEQYAGIAAPGTLLEYSASSEILVTTSNAMGLDIVWNGQPQGQIGGRGQRADMRFTVDEVEYNLGSPGAPTPLSPTAPVTATLTVSPAAIIVTATPFVEVVESESAPPVEAAVETAMPSDTALPSATPTATATPRAPDRASATPTPPISAILPPRVTQAGLPPAKAGL